jgi:zinc transporter ZupT
MGMEDTKKLNRILENAAWGFLFVWWGISFIPQFLPNGLDAAGTGLILLGVNAVRRWKGIAMNGFSLACGILCVVWGGLDLSRSVFNLPYRLPVFAILMIVLGVIVFAAAALRGRGAMRESR